MAWKDHILWKDLITWNRKKEEQKQPVAQSETITEHPMVTLRHRMNHLFDDFFKDFGTMTPSSLLGKLGGLHFLLVSM